MALLENNAKIWSVLRSLLLYYCNNFIITEIWYYCNYAVLLKYFHYYGITVIIQFLQYYCNNAALTSWKKIDLYTHPTIVWIKIFVHTTHNCLNKKQPNQFLCSAAQVLWYHLLFCIFCVVLCIWHAGIIFEEQFIYLFQSRSTCLIFPVIICSISFLFFPPITTPNCRSRNTDHL